MNKNQYEEINFNKVKEEFLKNGHTLISSEYKGFYEKLDYICRCGSKANGSYGVIKRGGGCVSCRSIKTGQAKRETEESLKIIVEEKNCKFIEAFTLKGKTRIKYICFCGSPHETYMCNFKKGYKCKECKRRSFQGENNHNFNVNLSEYDRLELGRYEEGYKEWRRLIFKKFNYKCDVCKKESDNDLVAHHLKGYKNNPKLRVDLNNGVCLCEECHKEFHLTFGYGDNTKKQYSIFKKINEM